MFGNTSSCQLSAATKIHNDWARFDVLCGRWWPQSWPSQLLSILGGRGRTKVINAHWFIYWEGSTVAIPWLGMKSYPAYSVATIEQYIAPPISHLLACPVGSPQMHLLMEHFSKMVMKSAQQMWTKPSISFKRFCWFINGMRKCWIMFSNSKRNNMNGTKQLKSSKLGTWCGYNCTKSRCKD